MNWKCAQPGCNVAVDGKCVDGISPIDRCPKLEALPHGATVTDGANAAADQSDAFASTHLGRALPFNQLGQLLGLHSSQLVVLAGPHAAGKTTLLASIYQYFVHQVPDQFGFCSSETLMGFEERCFRARVQSGSRTEDTAHTPRGSTEFLHLNLRSNTGRKARDLVFSDVSGEDFQLAGADEAEAALLDYMKAASRLVLVVDASVLVSGKQKFSAFSSQQSFLGMAVSAGMIEGIEAIDVVATKWDLAHASPKAAEVASRLNQHEIEVLRLTGGRVPIQKHIVASRPSADAVVSRWHGFDTLLASWLETKDRSTLGDVGIVESNRGPGRFVRHVSGAS